MIAQKQLNFSYDTKYDILYVDIGKPCVGYSDEVKDDIYIRFCDATDRPVGCTIISYKSKEVKELKRVIPIDINWDYINNNLYSYSKNIG